MQKQINQIQSKPGITYSPLHYSLQQQLQHWIAEEIYYLKETARFSNSKVNADEIFRWKDFNVITKFSVAQLGHVIKLLADTGIFINSTPYWQDRLR
ncbi:hypothetical protein [Chitinophaga polysaccharea]|nr:hypothetical protein [Chitinophaga polysaccharea]